MWLATALLILVGWTGLGFVAALLFFRLGFGFEARRGAAERMPQPPEPDPHRHRAADRSYGLTPADYPRRRRRAEPTGVVAAAERRSERSRGRRVRVAS